MDERSQRFIALSELLTGFSAVELLGTGVCGELLRTLDEILPDGVVDELLEVSGRLPADPAQAQAAASGLLGDPKLGPVARNLIELWYCGTWKALPDTWRSAYGTTALDKDHVVSPAAYQAGLQWVAAGAHPPGARQPGFGTWAEPPEGASGPAVGTGAPVPEGTGR